jgi:hypothetical protein
MPSSGEKAANNGSSREIAANNGSSREIAANNGSSRNKAPYYCGWPLLASILTMPSRPTHKKTPLLSERGFLFRKSTKDFSTLAL